MTQTSGEYSTANTVESEVYRMDFTNSMPSGDQLISAVWHLATVVGVDPSPDSHLVGSPTFPSSAVTAQRIAGLLPGVRYAVQCQVRTGLGNSYTQWCYLNCEPEP